MTAKKVASNCNEKKEKENNDQHEDHDQEGRG
jgi:hypothetical protein